MQATLWHFCVSLSVAPRLLDDKNFLLWRQQVEAVIKGLGLQRFVVNPEIAPQFLSENDRVASNVSEEYRRWEQQDQLLFSWLLSTLSEPFLIQVVGCAHSWELWGEIHDYFSTRARARVRQYRSELHNTKKGANESVSWYLLRIKALVETLAFEGFVALMDARENPHTIRETETLLLTHEAHIERNKQQQHGSDSEVRTQQPVHPSSGTGNGDWSLVPHNNNNSSNQHVQQFQLAGFLRSFAGGGRFGRGGGVQVVLPPYPPPSPPTPTASGLLAFALQQHLSSSVQPNPLPIQTSYADTTTTASTSPGATISPLFLGFY